jgi:polyisoprenoid-binding protein YceI
MPRYTRRTAMTALACLVPAFSLASVSQAAPTRYTLNKGDSNVGFSFVMGGSAQKGTMPVQNAKITIDPSNLAASQVDVSVSVAGARTGLIFATQALIGPDVLNAAQYPTIRFVSRSVKLAADGRLSGGARVLGDLTLHGVTRPVTLNANLYRQRGSAADDLSHLTVQLTGQISRSAFGAVGYPDLVADAVGLDITAVISASP